MDQESEQNLVFNDSLNVGQKDECCSRVLQQDTPLVSINIQNLEARVKKQEEDEGDSNGDQLDAKGLIAITQAEHEGNKSMHELLSDFENDSELNEKKGNFTSLDEETRSSQFKNSRNEVPCCSYSSNRRSTSTSFIGAKGTKSTKKRVTIHMKKNNSLKEHYGKLIILPDTLEELFKIAGELLFHLSIYLQIT